MEPNMITIALGVICIMVGALLAALALVKGGKDED